MFVHVQVHVYAYAFGHKSSTSGFIPQEPPTQAFSFVCVFI